MMRKARTEIVFGNVAVLTQFIVFETFKGVAALGIQSSNEDSMTCHGKMILVSRKKTCLKADTVFLRVGESRFASDASLQRLQTLDCRAPNKHPECIELGQRSIGIAFRGAAESLF